MSFLSFLARIVIGTVLQPGVQDVFSQVGRYAIRQGTAAIVRHIRNRTPPKRGSGIPTVR